MRLTKLATLACALLNSQINATSMESSQEEQLGFTALIDEVQQCQNDVFDKYADHFRECASSGDFEACFADY